MAVKTAKKPFAFKSTPAKPPELPTGFKLGSRVKVPRNTFRVTVESVYGDADGEAINVHETKKAKELLAWLEALKFGFDARSLSDVVLHVYVDEEFQKHGYSHDAHEFWVGFVGTDPLRGHEDYARLQRVLVTWFDENGIEFKVKLPKTFPVQMRC